MDKKNISKIKKQFPSDFNTKEKYYYKMVNNFFKNYKIEIMINIIDGKSNISLRILDWFVTSYAKKKKICYDINNNGEKDNFNVHINYKAQLKSYTKKYFDPFRRKKKFTYAYNSGENNVFTTIGQLNFFRWAISNNIINYVENNYEKIVKEMNKANKENKRYKEKKKLLKNNIKNNDKKTTVKMTTNTHIEEDNVNIVITFE